MSPIKIHVPCLDQHFEYDCGATALESICKYHLVGPNSHERFIKLLKTNTHGTELCRIKSLAFDLNLSFLEYHKMSISHLEWFIDLGKPIICPIQAWGCSHYVVAIGYDSDYLYFEDPFIKDARGYIEKSNFLERWDDEDYKGNPYKRYGLIIWKDGRKKKQKVTRVKPIIHDSIFKKI